MIAHPMETGYRMGPNGRRHPAQHHHAHFACDYDGEEVFSAEFLPAMSANPVRRLQHGGDQRAAR